MTTAVSQGIEHRDAIITGIRAAKRGQGGKKGSGFTFIPELEQFGQRLRCSPCA